MVMKSVRPVVTVAGVKCVLVCMLACILGCETVPIKKASELVKTDASLLLTEHYIPVVVVDKDELPLPYEAKLDPYGTQKGRIDKQVIVQFINSKRQLAAGQYDIAKSEAAELTESEPSLSGPWVVLGDVATQKNQLAEAELAYAKAIEVNIDNVNAYLKLALAQRQQGKYLVAQNTYAAALERWADFPEAHLNLAILYDLYLNHPIRAQRHFEAYQFLTDGKNDEANSWLADVQKRTGLAPKLQVGDDQRPEVAVND